QWAQNDNAFLGIKGPTALGYMVLDSVLSYQAPVGLDLVVSAPNSTQGTTNYTSSVGVSLNFQYNSVYGTYTIGNSLSRSLVQWVAMQQVRGSEVWHTWMQDYPWNYWFPDHQKLGGWSGWANDGNIPTNHMENLSSQSNGRESLNVENAAIYQTQSGYAGKIVNLIPAMWVDMGFIHDGGDKMDVTQVPFSPGSLAIDTSHTQAPAIQPLQLNVPAARAC